MEFLGKAIAVTVAELTRSDDGAAVMSYKNYQMLAYRGKIVVLRPGKGLAHPALIDWSSLPMRFKEAWIEKYGDPNDVRKAELEELRYDSDAVAFFSSYQLADGTFLKSAHQAEYVLNATVLNRLVDMAGEQKTVRSRCNMSSRINWEGIYNECEALRVNYGHTLPKNVARLRDKIRQYKATGYECLISGKLCNNSAVKITPEAGKQIIALKRSRFPRRTNAQIFEEFNRIAAEKGWKPLKTQSSLVQFLSRPEVVAMWKDVEIGEYAFQMKTRRQHKTIMPQLRDSIWYGDGTKANLYYKVYDANQKKWKLATTMVFEVIDAATEALIGYHITPVENFESMYEAYRMAIEFSGHLPYELVYDHQGGSKRLEAQDWFDRISTVSRYTAPGNAPSKSIEKMFGIFQSQVLFQNHNFTGMNITSRMDSSHVDMEYLNANIDKMPTYQEFCKMYAECRDKWNAMPNSKTKQPRMEMYLSQVNPDTTVVTEGMKKNLYMVKSHRPVKCTNHGLVMTYNRQEYVYEVYKEKNGIATPDLEWMQRNLGRDFYIEFDPHDPRKDVRLYTKDDYGFRYVCDAGEYTVIHRSLLEQTHGESVFIRQMEWENKVQRVRDYIRKQMFEHDYQIAPEQFGYNRPNLKGISDKEFGRIFKELEDEGFIAELMGETPELPDNAAEVLPDSEGQYQKAVSNMTQETIASYWSVV